MAWSKLVMEMFGIRSMAEESEVTSVEDPSQLLVDAPAALSIANRQGPGKMRHINVNSLCLQE